MKVDDNDDDSASSDSEAVRREGVGGEGYQLYVFTDDGSFHGGDDMYTSLLSIHACYRKYVDAFKYPSLQRS